MADFESPRHKLLGYFADVLGFFAWVTLVFSGLMALPPALSFISRMGQALQGRAIFTFGESIANSIAIGQPVVDAMVAWIALKAIAMGLRIAVETDLNYRYSTTPTADHNSVASRWLTRFAIILAILAWIFAAVYLMTFANRLSITPYGSYQLGIQFAWDQLQWHRQLSDVTFLIEVMLSPLPPALTGIFFWLALTGIALGLNQVARTDRIYRNTPGDPEFDFDQDDEEGGNE